MVINGIEYRKASPKDAALLAQTRQKAWNATYRGIYPDSMIDEFDYDWHIRREEKNLQNPHIHTWLILSEGACHGYVTWIASEKPLWRDYHFRLYSLYLLPQLQGRGLGRRIFQGIQTQCRELGYGKLYVSCQPQNIPAMGFYSHMGGRIVAEDTGNEEQFMDTVEWEFDC